MGQPKITIASPVYNGQQYLSGSIESVLTQTFGDFELVITDNASTDATEQICRDFARKDRRIRYIRNPKNIGPVANFNLGVGLATGEYFRWHCYDDLMDPRCLESCLRQMEADPSLAVCQSQTELIDADGRRIEMFETERQLDADAAHLRFWSMIWAKSFPPIFGVMRTKLVRKTRLFRAYVGADRYFLAELLLLGGLHYVPECLFSIRVHPNAYRVKGSTPAAQREWYTPGGMRLPTFMQMPVASWAFVTTACQAPVGLDQKIRCLSHVGAWTIHELWGIVRRRSPFGRAANLTV